MHLLVQSQQWKHHNVWNQSKLTLQKLERVIDVVLVPLLLTLNRFHLLLWSFHQYFEQVNVGWYYTPSREFQIFKSGHSSTKLYCMISNFYSAESLFFRPKINDSLVLTHLFPCTLSLPPENLRKPKGFLFSGDRKRVH